MEQHRNNLYKTVYNSTLYIKKLRWPPHAFSKGAKVGFCDIWHAGHLVAIAYMTSSSCMDTLMAYISLSV